MNRACATCEWAHDRSAVRATCREGPVPAPVDLDHWCGRWRLREELIRSGAHLAPTEILKHFEKAPQ